MADTRYISKNRLTTEVNARRKVIALIGIPLALFLIYHLPSLWWIILLALIITILSAAATRRAGARGEDKTLNMLKYLPDDYVIFNQVDVPNRKAKRGFTELDLIVVGPNGVFVVEVKNNNSKVTGDENEPNWTAHKVGRGGTRYKSRVRNPIQQLKRQIHALSEHLKSKQASTWLEGIVFFSNRSCRVELKQPPSVPLLQRKGLVEHILNHKPKQSPQRLEEVKKVLIALKGAAG